MCRPLFSPRSCLGEKGALRPPALLLLPLLLMGARPAAGHLPPTLHGRGPRESCAHADHPGPVAHLEAMVQQPCRGHPSSARPLVSHCLQLKAPRCHGCAPALSPVSWEGPGPHTDAPEHSSGTGPVLGEGLEVSLPWPQGIQAPEAQKLPTFWEVLTALALATTGAEDIAFPDGPMEPCAVSEPCAMSEPVPTQGWGATAKGPASRLWAACPVAACPGQGAKPFPEAT